MDKKVQRHTQSLYHNNEILLEQDALTKATELIEISTSWRLIPYASQQYYVLENKVSTKQLHHVSTQETSYTFSSLLKINSVWNTEKEQLIEVYFTENRVTAPSKKGNAKVQEIDKIPDRPFYISFIENKPNKIIAHTSRDQSLLNIERGIASLMHINFENGPVSEIDVSGICNNFYNIKSSTKVNKIKTDCSHWDLKVNYRGEKPLGVHQKSFERVEYDLSADGQLLTASSVESHKLNLEAQPEVGTKVESLFVLKHSTFTSEPVEQLAYKTSDEAIKSLLDWYRVFDIEADVDGVISEIKDVNLKQQVALFANDLTDDLIGKEALAEAFVKLIPLARITKQEEFEDILKSNKKLHSQLVDLLGAAQTIDAHNAIHKIFDYNQNSDVDLWEKYLQSLSVGTHPDRSIIEDLFERLTSADTAIKNQKLQDSVLQCVTSLTHQSGLDAKDNLLKEIKQFILKNLHEDCEDEVCQTRYIRALQNLQDPSAIPILLKYALHEETKISIAAMQALKSFPTIHFNEKHRQAFTSIFYQIQKKYDSSARTLALDILLAMKPTPTQLGQLLDYLASSDRHFEIKTYVIQKLKMLSDKCPRFRALLESSLYERPHVNNYHIIGQKDSCKIKAAGKEVLDVVGKGTIEIQSKVNNKVLVFDVPNISRNLFSVLSTQDKLNNSEFMSTATSCKLLVNNEVLLVGNREVGGTLYKADIEPIILSARNEINSTEAVNTLQLYHERWGHQDKRHVQQKLKEELGINVKLDNKLCEFCVYGKSHRLPFGNREKASSPGELMSADVCGPFPASFSKTKYLFIFKDSYIKYCFGYFLKEKSEVKGVLKEVLDFAKTQENPIKEFLSDNGGEFDNFETRKVLREYGVTQRLTAPYTPQQNGGKYY
ncbi:microsomal triacylglycerol transfer protein-like [Calliphora vicina]|uniref:microsomal triacylglycerol transfer protein-like n=1 Tax=Calliphora vicina TaxID=7373 RepID=UPI00325BD9D2